MKITLYEKAAVPTPELRLRLIPYDTGAAVVAVDEKGETEWFLLNIDGDGQLNLDSGIGKETGLKLDRSGTLKIAA